MRFRRNPLFETELKTSPKYRAGLTDAAQDIKQSAEMISQSFRDTGHYGRSFFITETPDGPVVGNKDIAAHLIEWGSANNPPRAPLRRAVRAAGLDLKETH